MRPRRTALLFQTHYFDRGAARAFKRLTRALPTHYDPYVLIHLPPGAPVPRLLLKGVPHHVARTPDLQYPAYPGKCGGANWDLWKGGHTDLILLHFLRAKPDYERAWMVEYDVRFSGAWSRFFSAFEDIDADLIVPVLRRRTDQPDWMWWHTLRPPLPLDPAETFCAFMPVLRVSRAGWEAVDAAWRANWVGHSETIWPTAIAQAGLTLLDPGGDGPFTPAEFRNRFYTSTMSDVCLAPGTLMWKPPLYRQGSQPDMLWHPIKPFWPRVEFRQAIRDLRIDLGAARRRLLAWLNPDLPRKTARKQP